MFVIWKDTEVVALSTIKQLGLLRKVKDKMGIYCLKKFQYHSLHQTTIEKIYMCVRG